MIEKSTLIKNLFYREEILSNHIHDKHFVAFCFLLPDGLVGNCG